VNQIKQSSRQPRKFFTPSAVATANRVSGVSTFSGCATFLSRVFYLLLSLAIFPATSLLANNTNITNVEIVEQDTAADTVVIEFDLKWENSFRDSVNYDAHWVFFKYSTLYTDTNVAWSHATMKTAGTNPSGFSDGTKAAASVFTSMDMIVPDDKMGVFLQPAHPGAGAIEFSDIQVVWDYAADGVSDGNVVDVNNTKIKAFAVEMVYIPEGAFYAGDGNSGGRGELEFESSIPGVVDGTQMEFDSIVGTEHAWYYNTTTGDSPSSDVSSGTIFTVGQSWPTGYKAFYVMKHEISQGQYSDFLNNLLQPAQNNRTKAVLTNEDDDNTYVMVAEDQATVSNRQTILADSNPEDAHPYTFGCDYDDDGTIDESAGDGREIAMNYMSYLDLAAFSDWAALRPMTELEFEKAARGPLYPLLNEYTWGSTGLIDADTVVLEGLYNEKVSQAGNDGLANYGNDNVTGPLRVGFAAAGTNVDTRLEAGASYYGVMELSGNVWEYTVTLGNTKGRGFAGTHGDGVLASASGYEGNATNSDWPGFNESAAEQGVIGDFGAGRRGGSWASTTIAELQISDRDHASSMDVTIRKNDRGGRAVRSLDS
jgi:formylglycine-generating enzyme required for sulfatase activity